MPKQNGELIDWNDARGFGFIRPDGGGQTIFVHISKISRIATRPRIGDRVSFSTMPGRDGKLAATDVLIAGANPIQGRAAARGVEPAIHHHRSIRLRFYVAGILSALVVAGTLSGSVPYILVAAYPAIGLASAAFYYNDKRVAETGGWRTSEARLHLLDLAFGIIGGLLAQEIFRHKTAKREFAVTSYAIATLHALLLVGLLGGRLSVAELTSLIPG